MDVHGGQTKDDGSDNIGSALEAGAAHVSGSDVLSTSATRGPGGAGGQET